ncbi:MAG: hypothetical protein SCALA702_03030 [Melioribacteraceae bacterium]|nr:MAG: hypothetical protein SCALA702_03030 [Melioribacteraceae bacterium]
MRNIYFIIFILILLTTITQVAENQEKTIPQNSFNLFDGGKGGIITTDDTKASLVDKFGIEALNDESIWIDEGTIEVKVTKLFKNTNPVTLFWDNDMTVSKVVIDELNSSWKVNGIACGTSIKELVNINKSGFKFNGFGWDNGGVVTDWGDGELGEQLSNTLIELGLDWEVLEEKNINPDKFMGDGITLNSDNTELDQLNIRVSRIVLQL